MSVGVKLGVLGLLLLASSANCKFHKFVFAVYTPVYVHTMFSINGYTILPLAKHIHDSVSAFPIQHSKT